MGNFDEYPWINQQEGISRVAGNKKLYVKLLNTFIANTREQELLDAIAEGDMGKAVLSAHAIKGVAANLSMLRLRYFAASIEEEINKGKTEGDETVLSRIDTAAVSAMINETLEHVKAVVAELEIGL